MCNLCLTNISYLGFAARVVTPELVHGESSSPATSVKDICKDGGLLKMILKEGEDWENPNDPDDVLGIRDRVSNIFVFSLDDPFILFSGVKC
jgi:hypothetical protein